MNTINRRNLKVLTTGLLCLLLLSMLGTAAHAQGGSGTTQCALPGDNSLQSLFPGDKAVYGATSETNSHSYVDASTFFTPPATGPADVCGPINSALLYLQNKGTTSSCKTSQYVNKGVVDARGIFPLTAGAGLTCSTYPFPSGSLSATVLLPAGTITGGAGLQSTWVLPANVRLVGEGANATTLVFNLPSGGNLIEMSYATPPFNTTSKCPNATGVAIEHLSISNGGSGAVTGIFNNIAQELNSVNDVALTNINGAGSTGLMIVGEFDGYPNWLGCADNSGPYTNIYFSGTGTCVNINGTYATRGINGLTCDAGTGGSAAPAILLDGSNNTIQNVSISHYTGDGIVIGSQVNSVTSNNVFGYAQNNLLFNITGSSVANLIHICGSSDTSSSCNTPANPAPPSDLTLMGINGGATASIQDDLTGSTLSGSVGLYVLGEPLPTGGYSRFTTNGGYPAWYVGPTGSGVAKNSSCGTGVANGSLYSFTSGTTSATQPTLLGCIGGNWIALSSN
jgi:hypothetical protein